MCSVSWICFKKKKKKIISFFTAYESPTREESVQVRTQVWI